MGIFGGSRDEQSAQEQVDLDHLRDRLTKLEAAVASLQGQVAALTGGAVAAGGQAAAEAGGVPYSGASSVAPTTEWMTEVRELVARGNKIQAIKVYREHTGLGLKESKDAIEAL